MAQDEKRKPTAADRPQFRRDAAALMERLGAQVGEPDSAAVILCSHASEFDPASNVLWEDEANKSAVRADVHCTACNGQVAMSNHAYDRSRAMDKRPRICCTRCLPALVASSEANP